MATPPVERRSLQEATAHHYFIPASFQAFRILHFGYVIAPLLAGLDKFFNTLVPWTMYLSPRVTMFTGIPAQKFMYGVGVVEIVGAFLVAFKPRQGGLVVALWLLGVIVNLLSIPAYYDVALRDLGLCLGALALSRLSIEFEQYRPHTLRTKTLRPLF